MPKKTKLMGWQCSECDKDSSGSDVECLDPEAPRQLRKLKDGNGNGDTPTKSEVSCGDFEQDVHLIVKLCISRKFSQP